MSRDIFHGQARRETPMFREGPLGPWGAEVKIIPMRLRSGWNFEVHAAWTGPPQWGFPPDPRPGSRSDTLVVQRLELARELAGRAVDSLRAGETRDGRAAIDLRAVHRELVARVGSPYVDPVLGAGAPAP